jgi:hypothetical protein
MSQSPSNKILQHLIDLEQYPLNKLHSNAGLAMSDHWRNTLATDGMCQLSGFLTPEAVKTLERECMEFESQAYDGLKACTPYSDTGDSSFPADHSRNMNTPRQVGIVAADLIPDESNLKQLYYSEYFTEFLALLLSKEKLHHIKDLYQSVNILSMPEGKGQNWHFDDADFVITLLIRKPEWGGEFECVPELRSDDEENFDEVEKVLQGKHDNVQVVKFEPGTLMIFRGHYSLHRVSPVKSSYNRLVAVMNYSTEPNWVGSPKVNNDIYGLDQRTLSEH